MFDKDELLEKYRFDLEPGKSHVRINFVSSADGAVTLNGRSGELGNQTDRALMKVLRAMSDVVLVGAGTVRSEGYGGLGLKEDDLARRQALRLTSPVRTAIVSNSLDLEPSRSVFQKAEVRPIVITHEEADPERVVALGDVSDVVFAGRKRVEQRLALIALADLGLSRVLCEGGPHLFGALLDEDLVDEVCLTLSPTFVGGSAGRIASGQIEKGRRFRLLSTLQDDDGMLFLRYAK